MSILIIKIFEFEFDMCQVTGGDFTSELAARLGATAAGSSSSAAGEGSKRRSSIKKSSGVPAPAAKSKETSRKPVAGMIFMACNISCSFFPQSMLLGNFNSKWVPDIGPG